MLHSSGLGLSLLVGTPCAWVHAELLSACSLGKIGLPFASVGWNVPSKESFLFFEKQLKTRRVIPNAVCPRRCMCSQAMATPGPTSGSQGSSLLTSQTCGCRADIQKVP